MPSSREFPERPLVGVGGVVIENRRALLIRRASEPLRGEWSIPGGMLKLGETLQEGCARELLEETGLQVRVIELIEVFERIVYADAQIPAVGATNEIARPRYHYVIADYLCERVGGDPVAASDATEVEFATEDELPRFHLTPTALRILYSAFAMYRTRTLSPQR